MKAYLIGETVFATRRDAERFKSEVDSVWERREDKHVHRTETQIVEVECMSYDVDVPFAFTHAWEQERTAGLAQNEPPKSTETI